MSQNHRRIYLLIALAGVLFLGDSRLPDIVVVSPVLADSLVYDQGVLLLVSAAKESGGVLLLSTQWEMEKSVDLSTKESREGFIRDFYGMFQADMTIEDLRFQYKEFRGYTKPDTMHFAYTDTMRIRTLWTKKEFSDLMKLSQTTEATELILYARGWRDSVYEAVYDDPTNDTRSLYKVHVQLLPGQNTLYLAPAGRRDLAVAYPVKFKNESRPVQAKPVKFHGSTTEENCIACHEGLPAGTNGETMTADCGVCHKALAGGSYVHAPVEMRECGACHAWSSSSRSFAMTAESPEVCYTCHAEKKVLADSAVTQHAVAGDCMGCHSPHSSNQKHILKQSTYALCVGCHDAYKLNHPVGRHPMRFAVVKSTGEEISCATCHNPHGSANESLLKSGGGPMMICLDCHDQ